MSIKVSGVDVFYDELKRKLIDKNTLLLDLKQYLYFNRHDPQLVDYLIKKLNENDVIIKTNSLISIYILLADFNTTNKLDEHEQELFNNLVVNANIGVDAATLINYIHEELDGK